MLSPVSVLDHSHASHHPWPQKRMETAATPNSPIEKLAWKAVTFESSQEVSSASRELLLDMATSCAYLRKRIPQLVESYQADEDSSTKVHSQRAQELTQAVHNL